MLGCMAYAPDVVAVLMLAAVAFAAGSRRAGKRAAHDASERHAEMQRSFDELEHEARYDRLTELPNRWYVHESLGDAIEDARSAGGSAALLLLDLDRFKDVNDTFGHQYGDLLLCRVAERLPAELRGGDTVGRLGGDEFAVILPGADIETASITAGRLIEVLESPVEVEGQVLEVGATTGIVIFPDHGGDADTLLRHADVAMYSAKHHHRRMLVYGPDLDEHSPDRLALVSEQRRAIDNGELVLHFQPTVTYATRSVHGVEALARWLHPVRGLLPPGEFIPLAERTGLIAPLGIWVLRTAISQIA